MKTKPKKKLKKEVIVHKIGEHGAVMFETSGKYPRCAECGKLVKK